jgi:hypothetical protein
MEFSRHGAEVGGGDAGGRKVIATTAATVLLFAGLMVPAAAPCGALRSTATPILDIAASDGHAPLAVYAIGFSPSGHFAWLERRRATDREKTEWSIHIVDLVSDHFLGERWFETRRADIAGVCEKFGPAIAILLDKSGIQAVPATGFDQPGTTNDDPTGFDVRPGSPDAESGKTPYDVILRGRSGGKRLGSVFRVDVTAGEPPIGEPKIRGMLRNPFERRVAVFLTQEMVGSDGMQIPVVRVLGGRLDKGFVQNP